MAILLRGRKYHYRFRQDGKNYSGACLGVGVPPDAPPKIIAAIGKKALEYEAAVLSLPDSEKNSDFQIRAKLHSLIDTMSIEKVKEILNQLQPV